MTTWDEHAQLSPGGGHIVWMSSQQLPSVLQTDYWLMDASGSNKERITFFNDAGSSEYIAGGVTSGDSAWNADGTKLVAYLIVSQQSRSGRIVMLSLTGGSRSAPAARRSGFAEGGRGAVLARGDEPGENAGRVSREAAAPLSARTKILYGVGGIGNAVRNSLLALFTVFFYTSVQGLPGSLVGMAAAIGLVSDLALDPLIGHLSDRPGFRRTRRTLMLAAAVTAGLGFWALFSPPSGLTPGGLFAWLVATSLVSRVGMAFFAIPYFALGVELSQDYQERTAVSGVRGSSSCCPR